MKLRTESGELELKLRFRSFSDLAALPLETEWIWEGLLAQGAVTMLAGHPYVGKTMLVSALLKAMEGGSPFLGRETKQATALLVTEEHVVTLGPRAEQLQLHDLRSEIVSRGDGVLSVGWPTLVQQAAEYALESGHQLLIIDTFTGLAGLQGEEENDAGAITGRLRPLQAAAGEDLAVLFLHHLNKNGHPRGSSAFRGVTDATIRMLRESGKSEFRLQIESRFAPPGSLKGKLISTAEGLSYEAVGKSSGPKDLGTAIQSTDERLLQALREKPAGGLTYEDFNAIEGLSADQARKRFPSWRAQERIDRTGEGVRGDPFRWFPRTC